jgi:hypothetical protein
MGLFSGRSRGGSVAAKALGLISNNPGKVKSGIAKVGSFANKRTRGKYSRHIMGAQTKAGQAIDSVARKNGPGNNGGTNGSYRPR